MVAHTRYQLNLLIGGDIDLLYLGIPQVVGTEKLRQGEQLLLCKIATDMSCGHRNIGWPGDVLYHLALLIDVEIVARVGNDAQDRTATLHLYHHIARYRLVALALGNERHLVEHLLYGAAAHLIEESTRRVQALLLEQRHHIGCGHIACLQAVAHLQADAFAYLIGRFVAEGYRGKHDVACQEDEDDGGK